MLPEEVEEDTATEPDTLDIVGPVMEEPRILVGEESKLEVEAETELEIGIGKAESEIEGDTVE